MSRPRVFVTRLIPEAGLELLAPHCDLEVWPDELPPPRQEIMRRAPHVEGMLTLLTDRMDAEFMDAAPRLRVISNYAVGFDNVDLDAATARGIAVGHTPGVLTETTADLAFGLLLAAARLVVPGAEYVKAGRWRTWGPRVLLGMDVHHATLGLVGLGRIGTEVARRARGFDMRVLYSSRRRRPDVERALGVQFRPALSELLAESDFVSLHVPLTDGTYHLVDAAALRLMKPSAVLINTARGPVVDTTALLEALRAGTLWAAALDVTDPEPLPPDHPLLSLDNCLVVPHIGSASIAARGAMARMAAENLLAGLRGEPLRALANAAVEGRRRGPS